MQLRITHTTGYEYDGKANTSYNEARLTPQTTTDQLVAHTRLDITPSPWTHTYRDYFGTQVTAFEVLDPHDSLTVQAHATVLTNRSEPTAPVLTWEQVREAAVADVWTEYLVLPDLVAPTDDFAAAARSIAEAAARPGEAAAEVCALVNKQVTYLPGSTEVHGTAAVAWEQRAGVCQDMTHLAIGGLRSIGVPARYVSGYFHPQAEPEIGTTVQGESHAWVEWWDEGWHGYDLTNDQPISDRHVVIATGRDYDDVRPLSGIFAGARTSRMFVEVEITRLT